MLEDEKWKTTWVWGGGFNFEFFFFFFFTYMYIPCYAGSVIYKLHPQAHIFFLVTIHSRNIKNSLKYG